MLKAERVIASIFGGKFAAKFVEEIEDEADLIPFREPVFPGGRHQYDEAFAIRVNVKATVTAGIPGAIRTGRPGPRLVEAEGVT